MQAPCQPLPPPPTPGLPLSPGPSRDNSRHLADNSRQPVTIRVIQPRPLASPMPHPPTAHPPVRGGLQGTCLYRIAITPWMRGVGGQSAGGGFDLATFIVSHPHTPPLSPPIPPAPTSTPSPLTAAGLSLLGLPDGKIQKAGKMNRSDYRAVIPAVRGWPLARQDCLTPPRSPRIMRARGPDGPEGE